MEALTETEKAFGSAQRKVRIPMGMQLHEALEKAGTNSYLDWASEEKMSAFADGGQELKVTFVKATDVDNEQIVRLFEASGLTLVHPLVLTWFNCGYPYNTAEMPQGTAWQDNCGVWHIAKFNHWASVYPIEIKPSNDKWEGTWWFAGTEKK